MGDLALKFGIFTIAYNDYKDFIPSSCESRECGHQGHVDRQKLRRLGEANGSNLFSSVLD